MVDESEVVKTPAEAAYDTAIVRVWEDNRKARDEAHQLYDETVAADMKVHEEAVALACLTLYEATTPAREVRDKAIATATRIYNAGVEKAAKEFAESLTMESLTAEKGDKASD